MLETFQFVCDESKINYMFIFYILDELISAGRCDIVSLCVSAPQILHTGRTGAVSCLTGELAENAPELGNVGGEGDVRVQDDDLGQVGGQSFG